MSETALVVYIDVDDTLVRTTGNERIPIGGVSEHVIALAADGAQLYCWSSGGADYAREIAIELGIETCFVGFLPKPNVMVDDQDVNTWRRLVQVHPNRCHNMSVETYWRAINSSHPA